MKWLARIFFMFGCVALYIGIASAVKLVQGYGGLGALFVWIVFRTCFENIFQPRCEEVS